MANVRVPITLDYDEPSAAAMLAALYTCPPAKRLDTLAVVVKVHVEYDAAALERLAAALEAREAKGCTYIRIADVRAALEVDEENGDG